MCRLLFFFLYSMMLLVYGDFDFFMIFVVNNCCRWFWIFWNIDGGIFLCFCLKGILLFMFILCCILLLWLMFVLLVEKMFLFCFNILYLYCCWFCVRLVDEIFIKFIIFWFFEFVEVVCGWIFLISIGCSLYNNVLGGILIVFVVMLLMLIFIL